MGDALAGALARPVSGTLVQAPIGATTRLVTELPASLPITSSAPRLAVQPGTVDPMTLLPQARSSRSSPSGEAAGTGSGDEAQTAPPSGPSEPTTTPMPGTSSPVPTGGTP
jgi:hypothetical protein